MSKKSTDQLPAINVFRNGTGTFERYVPIATGGYGTKDKEKVTIINGNDCNVYMKSFSGDSDLPVESPIINASGETGTTGETIFVSLSHTGGTTGSFESIGATGLKDSFTGEGGASNNTGISETSPKSILTKPQSKINKVGYIVIRHMNSPQTAQYWIECCKCIRKFSNDPVVVIDDNSDAEYLANDFINLSEMSNVHIIRSNYPGRGEILPYYYLWRERMFDTAVILHDSTFIRSYIDTNVTDVKFLWHFGSLFRDCIKRYNELIFDLINSTELLPNSSNGKWKGCFGTQSIITLSFIDLIQEKYGFFNLMNSIRTRPDRMTLERLFGSICFANSNFENGISVNGDIFKHRDAFRFTYDNYMECLCDDNAFQGMKMVKVWTGR